MEKNVTFAEAKNWKKFFHRHLFLSRMAVVVYRTVKPVAEELSVAISRYVTA
ncbi:MAG: hypothetical protein WC330_07260 [Candidatus Omnitrophota bacterium]